MRLTQIIEALLFASDAPLSAADLSKVDERLDEDTVEAVIQELRAEYELSERSFQIYEVAGGFQLLTRPEFVAVLERYDSVPQPSRLSAPALEVLAIIAYRQPLGRAEIEDIRGVGSSGVLRTLVERDLVAPVGRSEGLGRPLLYGTTRKFLEHFGFRSLEDLPRPDELPVVLRERAAPQPEGDVVAETSSPAAEGAAAESSPADAPHADAAAADEQASGRVPADDAASADAVAEDAVAEDAVSEDTMIAGAVSDEAASDAAAADADPDAVSGGAPAADPVPPDPVESAEDGGVEESSDLVVDGEAALPGDAEGATVLVEDTAQDEVRGS